MHKKYRKVKAVVTSLKKGASFYASCGAAGIGLNTFWTWRKKNPRLDRLVEKVLETRTQMVVDALFKNALSGNTTAQIFWLTNRGPKDWRDRRNLVNVDASKHDHVTYKWSEKPQGDHPSILPARLPADDSQ